MISLVYFHLVLVALASLQCVDANAIDNTKLNSRLNSVPARKARVFKNYVDIVKSSPETVHHTAGSELQLDCVVAARPTPIVTWLKNGEPIEDYEVSANDVLLSEPGFATKVVSKLIVVAPSDGDQYTCSAVSGTNQDSSTTTVYTDGDEEELINLEKLLFKPVKPIITLNYNFTFQNIGTDLILPCRVFSYTKTQVFWQHNGENVAYENSGRMKMLPSGDLYVHGLKWADMGQFSCVAKNMYGKDTASTFVYPLQPN